jgi:rubrerythrin
MDSEGLTNLERQLLAALIGLRGSNNGWEADWCGEAPHEEDCQAALDAVLAAKKKGAVLVCENCGRSDQILTITPDGYCGVCRAL